MRTVAGRIVPAAVISIGKKRPISVDAINTDLYPEMFACELSASIDCARLIRGIASIAKLVAPVPAMERIASPAVNG
jgi:hypothetical protein